MITRALQKANVGELTAEVEKCAVSGCKGKEREASSVQNRKQQQTSHSVLPYLTLTQMSLHCCALLTQILSHHLSITGRLPTCSRRQGVLTLTARHVVHSQGGHAGVCACLFCLCMYKSAYLCQSTLDLQSGRTCRCVCQRGSVVTQHSNTPRPFNLTHRLQTFCCY